MENPGASLGHMNSLMGKLQARTERTRQEIETMTCDQFKLLSRNLSESSQNALTTTEADIAREIEAMQSRLTAKCSTVSQLFGSRLLQMFLLGLAVLMGITAGGWGLITWMGNRVQEMNQEISTLNQAKKIEQQTLSILLHRTWGIQFQTIEGKKYIILDPGVKVTSTATTTDGRQTLEIK